MTSKSKTLKTKAALKTPKGKKPTPKKVVKPVAVKATTPVEKVKPVTAPKAAPVVLGKAAKAVLVKPDPKPQVKPPTTVSNVKKEGKKVLGFVTAPVPVAPKPVAAAAVISGRKKLTIQELMQRMGG